MSQPATKTSPVTTTRMVTFQRSLLVRQVQLWQVPVNVNYDIDEWRANDMHGLDEHVLTNGTKVAQREEPIAESTDDLTLDVLRTDQCDLRKEPQ